MGWDRMGIGMWLKENEEAKGIKKEKKEESINVFLKFLFEGET